MLAVTWVTTGAASKLYQHKLLRFTWTWLNEALPILDVARNKEILPYNFKNPSSWRQTPEFTLTAPVWMTHLVRAVLVAQGGPTQYKPNGFNVVADQCMFRYRSTQLISHQLETISTLETNQPIQLFQLNKITAFKGWLPQ